MPSASKQKFSIADIAQVQRAQRWAKIIPPTPPSCDLCHRRAKWEHPLGGLRCNLCPKPEK